MDQHNKNEYKGNEPQDTFSQAYNNDNNTNALLSNELKFENYTSKVESQFSDPSYYNYTSYDNSFNRYGPFNSTPNLSSYNVNYMNYTDTKSQYRREGEIKRDDLMKTYVEIRREKNREAAKRHREKKAIYLKEMEERTRLLHHYNNDLRVAVESYDILLYALIPFIDDSIDNSDSDKMKRSLTNLNIHFNEILNVRDYFIPNTDRALGQESRINNEDIEKIFSKILKK
ncbi:hypothetical protein HERIO_1229 [Hepatospora eriocheir]|uniref:BZIP domain-containing protein n=1 Tax=Hepatospora eriocheir TaxID=1081669 RepID=A0A1X0QAR1_9MICR|nr:hypothetical protein HERIO_1229 [Hepatospora eriocheir]